MYMMDFFAASTEEKVMAAIQSGTVQYPAYVFIRSTDGKTGRLGFVDQNNVFKYIVGEECKQQVVSVSEFPEIGEENVLYIKDGVVYAWTGSEFKAQYKDHTAELKTLNDRLDAIGTKVDGLEKADETLTGQIEALDKKIDALEIPQECLCKPIKYDITDVPAGTIVDYREDEIRIMCPKGTEFVKQAVGSGGNPNSYYMTFKTYYPNKDVVGYMERLGDLADTEILTKSSTDEYGRVYQTTWLALADYDASTDSWIYRGKESSKDDYYGYDYQIDWYNADGVMIASDCVRINLSNEECHSTIEPYYVHGVQTDVDTLIAQIKDLEEQVKTLEGNSMTFVELE